MSDILEWIVVGVLVVVLWCVSVITLLAIFLFFTPPGWIILIMIAGKLMGIW